MQYLFKSKFIIFNDLDNCNTLIFLQFFSLWETEWMNNEHNALYNICMNSSFSSLHRIQNNNYGNGVGSNKKKKWKGEGTNDRHEEKRKISKNENKEWYVIKFLSLGFWEFPHVNSLCLTWL
jgi:hypothetical protein